MEYYNNHLLSYQLKGEISIGLLMIIHCLDYDCFKILNNHNIQLLHLQQAQYLLYTKPHRKPKR